MMQKELKERKQCSYKPSSVPIPSETIRVPVIYLVPESPLGSSTLPSTAVPEGTIGRAALNLRYT